jgi:hypothetical protein
VRSVLSGIIPSRIYAAAAHAALDESARASTIVAEAVAITPELTADDVEQAEHDRDPAVTHTFVQRLIGVGLPLPMSAAARVD